MNALPLSAAHLAIAAALMLFCGALSLALNLRLEKALFIASLRTIVQLTLIGYVLRWVFAVDNALLLCAVMLLMTSVAAHAALARAGRVYRGVAIDAFVSLALSSLITTFIVTALIIGVRPWHRAQYVIPLLGMILGNALTGVSLCLDTLLETLDEKRPEVENALALGATRWEAAREPLAQALRRGLIPNLNTMNVVGLVSLPGMMTGQILAGADPLQAVRYQIVVMFMITAAALLGCVLAALLAYRRLFNDRHQLRSEQLSKRQT